MMVRIAALLTFASITALVIERTTVRIDRLGSDKRSASTYGRMVHRSATKSPQKQVERQLANPGDAAFGRTENQHDLGGGL